ncbi:MAG: membrane dipeptidase [Bacillota bacterium]|nr:MAG: membrane dipeptidase [Bacillota bacterium]
MVGGATLNYRELHNDSLVVDTHCDTMLKVIRSRGAYRLRDAHEEGHVDIPRLLKGGVNLQFFAVYIEPQFKPDHALKRTLQLSDCFYNELAENKDEMSLILSSADLESARRENKIGALLSIEGGEALEGDLGVGTHLTCR